MSTSPVASSPAAPPLEGARFRYAGPADAAAITALIELAYRGAGRQGWDSESHLLTGPRTSEAEVSGLIADPGSRFVVIERDASILGCALIQRRGATSCTADGSGAYFGMFAIDPNMRGAGAGDALLAECERRVRSEWNAPTMSMTVINVRETLIAWYGRRGYHRTGARVPFPFTEFSGETTRDFDLIELRKDLA